MKHFPLILKLTFLAMSVLILGCAGSPGSGVTTGFDRAMTLEEFYGFCWPAQVNTNCMDDGLCQDFKAYLAQEHADKADCLKGCQEMQLAKWRQFAGFGCDPAINNSTDWCEKYCRMYFDYGPPSKPEEQKAAAEVQPDPGTNPMLGSDWGQMVPQKPE